MLDRFWSPAARAGCFFASAGFSLSVLGVNIGCNAIPFGADVTGLLPRVFKIVRGQLFCGLFSLAIVPWKLLTDGAGFITFLGSYNIFIAPICGIIITDYYFVKRGNIHVPSLFRPSSGSLYYYTKGWNLKALLCWVCAATFGIPGLVGSYHPTWVGVAATHIYEMVWIITFFSASAYYFTANMLMPAQVQPDGYSETISSKAFESYAATDGYLDGDALVEFPMVQVHDGLVGSGDSTASQEVVTEKV